MPDRVPLHQADGFPDVPAANGVTLNRSSQSVISPGITSEAVLLGGQIRNCADVPADPTPGHPRSPPGATMATSDHSALDQSAERSRCAAARTPAVHSRHSPYGALPSDREYAAEEGCGHDRKLWDGADGTGYRRRPGE